MVPHKVEGRNIGIHHGEWLGSWSPIHIRLESQSHPQGMPKWTNLQGKHGKTTHNLEMYHETENSNPKWPPNRWRSNNETWITTNYQQLIITNHLFIDNLSTLVTMHSVLVLPNVANHPQIPTGKLLSTILSFAFAALATFAALLTCAAPVAMVPAVQ